MSWAGVGRTERAATVPGDGYGFAQKCLNFSIRFFAHLPQAGGRSHILHSRFDMSNPLQNHICGKFCYARAIAVIHQGVILGHLSTMDIQI